MPPLFTYVLLVCLFACQPMLLGSSGIAYAFMPKCYGNSVMTIFNVPFYSDQHSLSCDWHLILIYLHGCVYVLTLGDHRISCALSLDAFRF